MLPTCESVQGSFLYKGLMNSYVLIKSLDAERCTVFPLQSIPKKSKIPHTSNIITEMEPIEAECPHRLPRPQTPKLIPEIYSQVGMKGYSGHWSTDAQRVHQRLWPASQPLTILQQISYFLQRIANARDTDWQNQAVTFLWKHSLVMTFPQMVPKHASNAAAERQPDSHTSRVRMVEGKWAWQLVAPQHSAPIPWEWHYPYVVSVPLQAMHTAHFYTLVKEQIQVHRTSWLQIPA